MIMPMMDALNLLIVSKGTLSNDTKYVKFNSLATFFTPWRKKGGKCKKQFAEENL